VKPKIVEPTLTAKFDWIFQRPRHCAKYRTKFYAK
jgi:hypothetical protein